jgi:hypothetical protein
VVAASWGTIKADAETVKRILDEEDGLLDS